MDDLLLLTGTEGWCADCDAVTIFVSVDPSTGELCCTACDGAFMVDPAALAA